MISRLALDNTTIRNCVLTVLAQQGSKYVPVGVSARHVHLSQPDIQRLFGPGYQLTPYKPLAQPGQFAAKEQVTLIGPKGTIENVRVLGPARGDTQVEVAFTDAMRLGVKNCPVRMSGNLVGTPGLRLAGPAGEIALDHGLIVAERHLHLSDAQARAYGVKNGDSVAVAVEGPRPVTLSGVICRVGSGHTLELHLDTDEANACCLTSSALVKLILPEQTSTSPNPCSTAAPIPIPTPVSQPAPAPAAPPPAAAPELVEDPLDLVTERDINDAFRDNHSCVYCETKAIITPAAADRAAETGIKIIRV